MLQAPRKFGLVERPLPEPGRGDVVVRIAATAVCHTDLSIYTGDHRRSRPARYITTVISSTGKFEMISVRSGWTISISSMRTPNS